MSIDDYCDELDELLAGCEPEAPGTDEVHGFMCAALCGPRPPSLSTCMSALFSSDEADAETDTETDTGELPVQLVELLARLYEDTRCSLEDGSFLPVVSCAPDNDDEADAQQWCRGFLFGMGLRRAHWNLDNPEVLDLLAPIVLLADPDAREGALASADSADAEALSRDVLAALPGSVNALRSFFKKASHLAVKRPARRSSAGRLRAHRRRPRR